MPFYSPFSRYNRVSLCCHKGETYWEQPLDFYELCQHIMSKHYRKTQWLGRLWFYSHGISNLCLTNSVKALRETYNRMSDKSAE